MFRYLSSSSQCAIFRQKVSFLHLDQDLYVSATSDDGNHDGKGVWPESIECIDCRRRRDRIPERFLSQRAGRSNGSKLLRIGSFQTGLCLLLGGENTLNCLLLTFLRCCWKHSQLGVWDVYIYAILLFSTFPILTPLLYSQLHILFISLSVSVCLSVCLSVSLLPCITE